MWFTRKKNLYLNVKLIHLRKKLILFALLSVNILSAQKIWDSTYYVKYKSRLIISFFQSYRNYNIELQQYLKKDTFSLSKLNYIAQANNISGIELNYDKLNFSFGYASIPPANVKQTGKTDHFNIGMNIGGNEWILETGYRRYQGFYDKNTPRYDSAFSKWDTTTIDKRGIYTQFPHMISTSYKMKFLYFTNHKRFSFKSGYSCAYRQIKSSFSWVITANGYYNTITTTDTSFFPKKVQPYYDTHANLNGLNVAAFSVYGGASLNIVLWRALFFNLTFLGGPEQQWRSYRYFKDTLHYNRTISYLAFSGDIRGSVGLNFKRWFVTLNGVTDFSYYKSGEMMFVSKYFSGQFSIGYRFKVKTPKIYQKFQQTKLYSYM
jgi:hypothetical protein